MKQFEDCSTKDAIIKATLRLIEKEGFKEVTIRKIAKLADVNVALINYHFGSKDQLLNEVIRIFVDSLKDSFTIFDDLSLTPKERIKAFLLQYLRAFRQYPFIGRRIIQEDPVLFNSQMEYMEFLRAIGLKKFQKAIQEISGEQNPRKLTIMTAHLMGATFSPTLVEPLYEKVTGNTFDDIETQVDILIEQYFGH